VYGITKAHKLEPTFTYPAIHTSTSCLVENNPDFMWFLTHTLRRSDFGHEDTIVIANVMVQDCSDPATKKSKVE